MPKRDDPYYYNFLPKGPPPCVECTRTVALPRILSRPGEIRSTRLCEPCADDAVMRGWFVLTIAPDDEPTPYVASLSAQPMAVH